MLVGIDAELDRIYLWGKIQAKIDVYQFGI